ncbi:MAG: hypothetical protein ACK54H_00350 [Phycisphaerales bacterium]
MTQKMMGLTDSSWVFAALGLAVVSLGMCHVIAGTLEHHKQIHSLRIRVNSLRLERVSRLRKLQTEEDGGFEIVEDEPASQSREAA